MMFPRKKERSKRHCLGGKEDDEEEEETGGGDKKKTCKNFFTRFKIFFEAFLFRRDVGDNQGRRRRRRKCWWRRLSLSVGHLQDVSCVQEPRDWWVPPFKGDKPNAALKKKKERAGSP